MDKSLWLAGALSIPQPLRACNGQPTAPQWGRNGTIPMTPKKSGANPNVLGEIVSQLRSDAGLTLYELEKRSGINRSTLMRIESGQHARPNSSTLNKLARGLGIDPEVLYDAAWDEAEAPLPSPAVYFRSKYRLNPDQIARMEASLRRVTEQPKTAKAKNKPTRKAKPNERRSP